MSDNWTPTVNEIYSVLDLPGCLLNKTQQMESIEKENSQLQEFVLPVEKDLPLFQKEVSCCPHRRLCAPFVFQYLVNA